MVLANNTIVSDVKGRAAFAFPLYGVSVTLPVVNSPFTHHIVDVIRQNLTRFNATFFLHSSAVETIIHPRKCVNMLSEKIAEFYNSIKADGLRSFVSDDSTQDELKLISRYLHPGDRILDLACGYGRLSVPLAAQGFSIKGLDISDELISSAHKYAKDEKQTVDFQVGNMLSLPYLDDQFNLVLCFWTSFSHLLTRKEQVKCLNEQHRVLSAKGTLLVDLVDGNKKAIRARLKSEGKGKQKRILVDTFRDSEHSEFIHDKCSLLSVLSGSKFSRYKAKYWVRAGKRRLLGIANK